MKSISSNPDLILIFILQNALDVCKNVRPKWLHSNIRESPYTDSYKRNHTNRVVCKTCLRLSLLLECKWRVPFESATAKFS